MSSETIRKSGIEERYAGELVGKLACFDRMIIFGTWKALAHAQAVSQVLARRGLGAFELAEFAQPLSAAVHERAAALAEDLDGQFELLVRTYQDRLYSFALRLSRSREDAEEIAQDAFVRAYRALKTYAPERIAALSLRAWLYQIALNVTRNRFRRRRPVHVSLEGPAGEGAPA